MANNEEIYGAITDLGKTFKKEQIELKKDLKEHIDLKVAPIKEDLDEHIDEHVEYKKLKRKIIIGALISVITATCLAVGGCIVTGVKFWARLNIEKLNSEFVLPKKIVSEEIIP